ncbi:MAG TPA: adenylate/guanylate cyclase domain-containing protein [Ktedonobacterales bacterium]
MPEERKLVTILFADVTGSTALGETLDPEDVRTLMGRYYQHARQILAEHGGTLEKFIGDAVMAIFGLPQAHGNDPERALAAALALRAALADDTLLAGRLLLRIGVNIGEVVATRDTSAGDFLITGDAVNVAARLQQAASPGEILVGERARTASVMAFHFGEARALEVKGKSAPLTAFSLLSARTARALSRPPLVGRSRELAQLGLLRDAVLEERHPQLVSIVAPAGTGKTRVLEEFLAGLRAEGGWRVATARCPPYGQALTSWPLRGLLDELLGERFSLARVTQAFAAAGHAEADAERLAELLLAALGIESEVSAQRESIFNAWRLFIEALAQQTPRIVVFEDLHWASDSLLDLVEHITHLRTRAPLLIVVLSRPELLDRRPSWGGGRRSFTALELDGLNEAQTRQLVGSLAPTLGSETARERVVAHIVEHSGGNPFFAIELARGLAERLGASAAQASADLGSATVDALPDTVHEAVLARLDQLAEPEREALQAAAVAGRTFRLPTLVAALPQRDPAALATALEGLVERDLVTPAEGEDEAYTFRHILFREVAYGTLTRAERVRLHLAVARWLEAYAHDRQDEFVELLAYHYREAATLARQSVTPLDVGVDPNRAIHYLVRAGELASRAGLLAPAISHLRAAIGLAPEEEHLPLYEQLGDCAIYGDGAVEAYQRALTLWREHGQLDPLIGARLLRKLLTVYWYFVGSASAQPSWEESAALHAEALALAEQSADENEIWRVRIAPLNPLARAISRDECERIRDICAAAVGFFEQRHDWPALSMALDEFAGCELTLGAYEEARETQKRRLAWPQLPAWARGDVQSNIVKSYVEAGEYDASITTVQDVLSQVRPGDPLEPLAEGVAWAIFAADLCGRWDDVESLQHAMTRIWDEMQQTPGLYNLGLWGGYMHVLQVALAREDRIASDAVAAVLERAWPPSHPAAPVMRSVVDAYRADDPTRFDLDGLVQAPVGTYWALLYLEEHDLSAPDALIAVVRKRDDESSLLNTLMLTEAAEALASGDSVRLAAAIDAMGARRLIAHAARMRIVLAQRTGDPAPLERARPVLERLGDRQFLRRLDEAERALSDLPTRVEPS